MTKPAFYSNQSFTGVDGMSIRPRGINMENISFNVLHCASPPASLAVRDWAVDRVYFNVSIWWDTLLGVSEQLR